ncbi:hypothetical protein CQW23_29854 [Capsicum baccatum]|uniref:Serine/threonine-protein kinase TOR n=1 Tax=Capsicum baccatum TaxID=33114 RepID=A0A2G2VC93_CAPBA|nr:hypothetical protein CQW23_29854 [Capsicum baccatum]
METEKVFVVPAEGNESDSLERDLGQEAQPLEMMESPIRHNEDNVGAYQILGISLLVLSLLAGTVLYVKRRSDKTLHPVAVSKDDEVQSIEKKPRKSNRRESLAASKFSIGSPSYRSFTTYVRISAKHRKKLVILVEKLLLVSWIIYMNALLHFLIVMKFSENLGALRANYELIDVTISENASKVAKSSNYMHAAFETKRDPEILVLASKDLGHLARSGGAMTTYEVKRQVKVALKWLRGEIIEYRRFAAVLILKKMAENALIVFNVHMSEFVDAIWVALRDPKLVVRGKSVEAFSVCLRVIEKRETRWRVQWYYRMFEATQDGLGRNVPVHNIHGSLLAVREMLRIWMNEICIFNVDYCELKFVDFTSTDMHE